MRVYEEHNGKKVIFDKFRYYIEDGDYKERLTSATQFVNNFFPKFDADMVAGKYAKKHGLKKADVLADWKRKGDKGRAIGNACHKYVEYKAKNKDTSRLKVDPRFEVADDVFEELKNEGYRILDVEKILFSKRFGVAGKVDIVLGNEETLLIPDWKFGKSIDTENVWETALSPIDHLDNCNYNKYALQTNLFRFIVRRENYYPEYKQQVMEIIHITPTDFDRIRVHDMTTEIIEMIIEIKNGKGRDGKKKEKKGSKTIM